MKKLLNNLYITTDGSYLHKERETLLVEQEGKKVFQLPLHALQNIFCFGNVMVSPALMGACGKSGIGLSFFSEYGKFQARVQGPQTGNVLLRRAQYRFADNRPYLLAKLFIAAKLNNSRNLIMKHQRNHGKDEELEKSVDYFSGSLRQLNVCEDLDKMRGIEGDAAAVYFSIFYKLIVANQREDFSFSKGYDLALM